MNISTALVLILFFLPLATPWSYFCDLKCDGVPNIVCNMEVRMPCKPNAKCGAKFEMQPYSNGERKYIVNMHNEMRNGLATGQTYLTDADPKAANMRALSYSRELEFVAQCWANNCDAPGSDACRRTRKFKHVGQNIFLATVPFFKRYLTAHNITEFAVQFWDAEFADLLQNPDVIRKYTNSSKWQHAAQLMWAETTFVGCGRTVYGNSGDDRSMLIVCNYGTQGNVLGKPVYIAGAPCSQCPSDAPCNSKYSGLCGRVRDLNRDRWIEPFTLVGVRRSLSRSVSVVILCIFVINNFM